MIYITGDLHGEIERLESKAVKKLKKGDTLIVCGDFGFVWDGSEREKKVLKKLGKQKYRILFVAGCHDNYDLLESYPTIELCGGQVRQISGNLYELLRGEVYEIDGKTVFAFGGGTSDDEHLREEGVTWWKNEMPDDTEYERAIQNLAAHHNEIDYIVTHDMSTSMKQFINIKENDNEVEKIHAFLNALSKNVKFGYWFFGQYHQDKQIPPRYYAMFRNVILAPGQEVKKKKSAH